MYDSEEVMALRATSTYESYAAVPMDHDAAGFSPRYCISIAALDFHGRA